MDPDAHRIRGTPPGTSAYLMEDWCTPAEETYLLGRVYRGASGASGGWTQLSGRRLQNHGGVAHEKGMIPTKMPDWLEKQIPEVQRACGALMPAHINHVLVNEYRAGEGIMPHQDGPLYTPAVAIASLGCGATMRFTPHRGVADDGAAHPNDADVDAASFGVWLPPRSLLLFDGTLYDSYLHGIDFASEDRLDHSIVNRERAAALVGGAETAPREATRVSLTFRNVRKLCARLERDAMDETRDAPRGDAELARRTSTFASAGLSEGPTRERTMALWFANHRRVTAGTISISTPVYWETPRERDSPQDDARESIASLTPASSLGASSAASSRDPRDRPASPDREPSGDFLARLCCRPRTQRDDAATNARRRRP